MIRVLHYLRHLDLGGTAKTCQLFFENASKDFKVALVHEAEGDKTRLEEFQKSRRVCNGQIFSVDSKGQTDPTDLQAVIDHFKPDILHVYRSGFPEFPVGMVNVPHVVETNVFGFIDPHPIIKRSLFMSKWLMNHSMRQYGINAKEYPRFDYVNNPVEKPYTGTPMSGFVQDDTIWVGRCGRPDNGIYNSVSVDAVRLLRMQGYDIRFLVVAPPSNMLLDLANYDIPFKVIEPTTHPLILSQFYNTIDIYTHARADGETYGVNIAEAMMHGKPVITHIATPSHPGMGVFQAQTELVTNGETGFVVENNPAAYAKALKTLIDNLSLRKQMGTAGLIKANRECHTSVCMKKLESIYRDVYNE